MPYQGIAEGLYVLRQFRPDKLVFHYGILDVGNRLQLANAVPWGEPVVVHQPPTGLRVEALSQTTGEWQLLSRVDDEAAARERLVEAMKSPQYGLFGNNCEHFVTFVAKGVRESSQLQLAGLAVVGGLLVLAARRSAA